ncbi:MAG: SCO family protein [Alphaproteobacteria bacterium]
MKTLRLVRIVAWIAVALALTLLFGYWKSLPSKKSEDAAITSPMRLGGSFSLVDHTGEAVTDKDYRGKPHLRFFGFTHCPDVCPTTLSWLADLVEQSGGDVPILLVSVDPERDTPEVLADYVSSFGPNIVGLTGTVDQIDAVVKSWGAYSKRVPQEGGGYTMDHTASVYLVDGDGAFRGTLDIHDASPTANLAKLKRLLESN